MEDNKNYEENIDENITDGECEDCSEGSCSSCSGCGNYKPDFDGPNVGKRVKVHYKGTFDNGTQFDSSYDRGLPLEFECGAGRMIHGFDKAVATMNAGETVNIHLTPDEAYGERNPEAIINVKISELPGADNLNVGDHVALTNSFGQSFPVIVIEKDDDNIVFDANHEMAGKELNFQIELVEIL